VTEGRILVTGGAGFIGSHYVRSVVAKGGEVVTLDALTYAGNIANLDTVQDAPNHHFITGNIADRDLVARLLAEHRPMAIVNFAAESHVDRSIDGPATFIDSNIVGVFVLLEACREHLRDRQDVDAFRFLHVSTDEVYGPIKQDAATEDERYNPSSPYAASKAAADHLVRAWNRTYGVPAIITNCTNNYGPNQFPEKLIPLTISKALQDESLPLYGDGLQERDWLHVEDHCHALDAVLSAGTAGQTYNIASGEARSNRAVVEEVCATLDRLRPRASGAPYHTLIENVADRPGHDRRYALDGSRVRVEVGWAPEIPFSKGLTDTVSWYLENDRWIKASRQRYDGSRLGAMAQGR
tara:strand:- start:5050 stop:6108 length:1059 start_codon:yes stop_codon:yes gene_type:complete